MDLKQLLSKIQIDVSKFELNASVDCVIFTIQENKLKVLLTSFLPETPWMLPGGFIGKQENAGTAAKRILLERTGAENVYLQEFKTFSNPDRFSIEPLVSHLILDDEERKKISELHKRIFSIGYFALVNFESLTLTGGLFDENTRWADVEQLPQLMHDHTEIILEAIDALRKELYFKPIGYNLLPEKFTMPELQNLYEIILNKSIDRSSFQRKMLKWDIYKRLEERREGVAHKRPFLYVFNKEKYKLAIQQRINFGI